MKSYRSLVLAGASALVIAGCASSDANMKMMEEMEKMQSQLNSIETATMRAEEMAREALTKASHNESVIMKKHGRSMMK